MVFVYEWYKNTDRNWLAQMKRHTLRGVLQLKSIEAWYTQSVIKAQEVKLAC